MRSDFDLFLTLNLKFVILVPIDLVGWSHINNLIDCLEGCVGVGLRWLFVVRNFTLLPHKEQVLAHIVYIRLTTLYQFTGLETQLIDEVFRISPIVNAKNVNQVLLLCFV